MFFLSRVLQQLQFHRQLEVMADQIAAACGDRVWNRVAPVVESLGISQARGYVRARALAVVHAELQQGASRHEVRGQLQELALQKIIDRTIQAAQRRNSSTPLRRAA